jgi:hypothetical protein
VLYLYLRQYTHTVTDGRPAELSQILIPALLWPEPEDVSAAVAKTMPKIEEGQFDVVEYSGHRCIAIDSVVRGWPLERVWAIRPQVHTSHARVDIVPIWRVNLRTGVSTSDDESLAGMGENWREVRY